MRIHLIKEKTIRNYCEGQARAKPSFEEWLSKSEEADRNVPNDVKATFGTADLLGKSSSGLYLI